MNILLIDTSNNKETVVGLKSDGKELLLREAADRKSQHVLPLLDKVLEQNQLRLEQLEAIEVNLGPGSFTGLRVGVAVANTLGLVLQIPINGQPVGKPVEPVYE
jgi:tRNA threonylcarbamoyladenosine biosynthesis protein TsaB